MTIPNQSQQNQQGSTGASAQQGGGTGPGQQNQFAGAGGQQGGQQAGQQGNAQQGGNVAPRSGEQPALWRRANSPFELMRRMDEEMDRLFRSVWGGAGRSLLRSRGEAPAMWLPQVEVFERDGRLHVQADLPGLRKEDVKLSIDDGQLVIEGERRSSHEEDATARGGYFHSERSYGSFYRSIPLPEGVDTGAAEASFENGVLKVEFPLPQPRQTQRRQLDIR
jgi:HSP20 family protein